MKKFKDPLIMLLLLLLIASSSCKKDDGNNDIIIDDDVINNDGNNETAEIPNEGLVAYYPFNGNTNDESDNQNDGINFGATLTADRFGNQNKAFQFDGIDDFIEIIPVSDVSAIGDFTFSVWTYLEAWEKQEGYNEADFQYVFNGHAHSSLVTSEFFRPGFNIAFSLSNLGEENLLNYFLYTVNDLANNYLLTQKTLALSGQWRHLIWGRKGNQDFTYVDGQLVEQTYANHINKSTPMDMQHSWYIGTFSGNNPNYNDFNYNFHGKIDDLRFYNMALEEKHIKAIFQE